MNCTLEYNSSNNQVKVSPIMSTLMAGPPEQMKKEHVVSQLISGIQSFEVQDEQNLIVQTNNGQQVQLERFVVAAPSPVTHNIFN
jgi:heat shock protein HslJ